jgi:hypothetical protein
MAIKYYPSRIYKGTQHAITNSVEKRKIKESQGVANLASTDLNVVISENDAWQVDSIAFSFNNATARDFSASIINGRKVVEHLNDSLWFQLNTTMPASIALTSGFYTGTALASELQSKLNTAFSPITFTVTYSNTTGLFVMAVLTIRDSIAGHLFGLNATTSFASNVTTDTAVAGLDSVAALLVNQTASIVTSAYHDDIHILSVDQAIKLIAVTGPATVLNHTVFYELIK